MAGAFQRLVARATGAPAAGLRPRLPTVFETSGAQQGFEEIQQETSVSTPTPPRPLRAEPPSSPETTHQAAVDTVAKAMPTNAAPASVHAPSEKPRNEIHADHPVERMQPPVQPAPLLSEKPAPFSETLAPLNVTSSLAMTNAEQSPEPQPTEKSADTLDPPAPLLRMSSPHEADRSGTLDSTTAPASSRTANASAQTTTAAPEITIHIGQLDVRSEQPQPVAPQRPAPRARNMPSLSDYLRGRGS